jgi:hypothetical protein
MRGLFLLLLFSAALMSSSAQEQARYEYEIIDSGPVWLIKVSTRSKAGDFTATTTADKSAYSYEAVKNKVERDKEKWLAKQGIEYTPEIINKEITAEPEEPDYFITFLCCLITVLVIVLLLRWYK